MAAIGIDLGTTYSRVAVCDGTAIDIILSEQGEAKIPSMVAFTQEQRLVGEPARHQLPNNTANTVTAVKRLLGRRRFPAGDPPLISVKYKDSPTDFAPEQVAAMLIAKLQRMAEQHLQDEVSGAVIAVPACFNDSQRHATLAAGTIAGLNGVRLLNEPAAAASAYAVHRSATAEPETVLVLDVGGGTTDAAVVFIAGREVTVRSATGDARLGGADFDDRLLNFCIRKLTAGNPGILLCDRSVHRLRAECEKAKHRLSGAEETVIAVDSVHAGVDFHTTFSRADFKDLTADLQARVADLVLSCIRDAGIDPAEAEAEINKILLIGGSSRTPGIRNLIRKLLPRKRISRSVNSEEAVVAGAAAAAASAVTIRDVSALSVAIAMNSSTACVAISRNAQLPARKTVRLGTAGDGDGPCVAASFRVHECTRTETAGPGNVLAEYGVASGDGCGDIDVMFVMNADGTVSVSVDADAGRVLEARDRGGRLTDEEIAAMAETEELVFRAGDHAAALRHYTRNEIEEYIRMIRAKVRRCGGVEGGDTAECLRTLASAEEWLCQHEHAPCVELEGMFEQLEKDVRRFTDVTLGDFCFGLN